MNRFFKYLLVMLLPLAVLLSRPVVPAVVLLLGQEVQLATEPFDPRDLFRGDYVELRFAIETVPLSLLSGDLLEKAKKAQDDNVQMVLYATLEPDKEGIYRVVRLTETRPSGGSYIRGKVASRFMSGWASNSLSLSYGNSLSRFYVKENTGLELERAAREGRVIALAKVWNGKIVLDSIRTLDKPK